MLEGVEMHFLACSGEATIYAGHPALRMRLPARVLRLQRREYFRVPAALPCEVVLDAHDRVQVLEMRTADLSMSGVTLLTDKALELEIGQLFERCHLPMGEHGELSAALEVRNLSGIRTRGGAPRLRVGCSFLALPPALEVSLARFIGKLERSSRR
jgi:c-di-GMP-binding flagellar brake protein YcgR